MPPVGRVTRSRKLGEAPPNPEPSAVDARPAPSAPSTAANGFECVKSGKAPAALGGWPAVETEFSRAVLADISMAAMIRPGWWMPGAGDFSGVWVTISPTLSGPGSPARASIPRKVRTLCSLDRL